jgi:hypothetical protein
MRELDDSDSSDDEGFEEVPIKEGYEEHVPPHLLKDALTDHPPRATVRSYTPWHVKDREHDIEDPTAHSSSVRGKHQERRTASNE